MARYDHSKLNKIIDGQNGRSISPKYDFRDFWKRTTDSQLSFIEKLIRDLDEHGIEHSHITADPKTDWHRYSTHARSVISALVRLKINNKIDSDLIRVFFNLVKDPEGKKYEYATVRWRACPKGYSYIGELRREVMLKDEFNSWSAKDRLQEFKSVS